MNRKKLFIYCIVWICFLIVSCNQISNNTDKQTELIVSAAASLSNVMSEIKPLYLQNQPEVEIVYNFASSGSLQRQIEQGAPVDVFISAAPKQMNILENQGLLYSDTRRNLLQNQMVLIVPSDNNTLNSFADLAGDRYTRIALGEPDSVPAGTYAQEILTNLGLDNAVKDKTVYAKDVRQVLNYVASGNVDAGIVYRTDATQSNQVKIVDVAPTDSHSPIVYPVALIKSTQQPEAAQSFVEFLTTPVAETVFKKYGFTPIE